MQGTTEFELKAQARRLREALTERGIKVSHTESLNLIARSHAERNWEALQARVAREVAPQAEKPSRTERELWLARVEAVLRMEGFGEADLDEGVHRLLGDQEASSVNNQGMRAQLEVMLASHEKPGNEPHVCGPRAALVDELEQYLEASLPLPHSTSKRNSKRAIDMEISICAGTQDAISMHFDALEWFVQASDADISRLVEDGLSDSESADDVALWFEKHSQDHESRKLVESLLVRMRWVHANKNPGAVGLTVSIDEEAVAQFVRTQPQARHRFSQGCLKKLRIV